MEDNGKTTDLILYRSKDGAVQMDVQLERDTLWLSLNQLAILFGRDKSVISRHLRKIYNEGELERNATVAKNATTAADGKTYQVEFYNLDAIRVSKGRRFTLGSAEKVGIRRIIEQKRPHGRTTNGCKTFVVVPSSALI